mmetsp:Transcript_68552/g.200549  ORF Transcript_68552/g.200549 Transcript_68552/m.200549 type:complete len:438 (-) Transcript_68552:22-1335(-)
MPRATVVVVGSGSAGGAIETPEDLWLHHSHDVVVEQYAAVPPLAGTGALASACCPAIAHNRDVVASARVAADVHDHAPQLVEPALGLRALVVLGRQRRALGRLGRGAPDLKTRSVAPPWAVLHNSQLQGEDNSVGQAAAATQALDVLEALEVEGQDTRELVHPQSFFCFLQAPAAVTEELIARAKQLRGLERAEAGRYGGVPLDVHREVQESLPAHRHVLAAEALHLIHKVALEDVVHPCPWLLLWLRRGTQSRLTRIRTSWGSSLAILLPLTLLLALALLLKPLLGVLHDVVEKKLHELVGVLVLRRAEEVVGLPQLCKEAPRREATHSSLLVLNLGEELRHDRQQGIAPRVLLPLLGEVLDGAPPEGGAEVERLQYTVYVAGVRHVRKPKVLLAVLARHSFAAVSVLAAWGKRDEAGAVGRSATHAHFGHAAKAF